MIPLSNIDLLSFQESLRFSSNANGASQVFDLIRKKFVRATPEEIVRQLWLMYFLEDRSINPKLIAVERSIQIHGMKKRFDVVVFSKNSEPLLLVELKAPQVALQQSAFDQIVQYNMGMKVPYTLISNGEKHYCIQIDHQQKAFTYLNHLPV